MLKKVGINACIGAVLCATGGLGWTLSSAPSGQKAGWEVLIIGSAWYAGISIAVGVCIGLIQAFKTTTPYVEQALNERHKDKAYSELLRLKKLCDENIITREEFDARASDLKAKLL